MNLNQKRERHPFTPDEDKKLRELVNRFGEKNWSIISGLMMNRSVRQCRDRWTNSLCANIVKGEWTAEEDSLLLQLFKEYGSRWKSMEKFFPGRAQYDIRNHCKSILRQKMYAINFLNQKRSITSSKVPLNCSLTNSKDKPSPMTTSTTIPIVTKESNEDQKLNDIESSQNSSSSHQKRNEESFNENYVNEKMLINKDRDVPSSNNLSSKKSFINLQKIDPILVPFISEPMLLGISSL